MLDKLYKNMLKHVHQQKTTKWPEIRPSSMPFCPKKFIFMTLDAKTSGTSIDYAKDFYLTMGSTVHRILQKWLPRANPGKIFGHWECPSCGEVFTYQVGPLTCPTCQVITDYRELSIYFPDAPIIGHSDGVLLSKKGSWILEYKSTSRFNAIYIKDPYHNHKFQGSMYTTALKRLLSNIGRKDIDIRGFIVKYVSRDDPKIVSRDFLTEVTKDSNYIFTCKLVNRSLDAIRNEDWEWLFRMNMCRKRPNTYENCSFEVLCDDTKAKDFKDIFKVVWKRLVPSIASRSLRLFVE